MILRMICVVLLWLAVAGADYYCGRTEESIRWRRVMKDALEQAIQTANDLEEYSETEWNEWASGAATFYEYIRDGEEKHHVL